MTPKRKAVEPASSNANATGGTGNDTSAKRAKPGEQPLPDDEQIEDMARQSLMEQHIKELESRYSNVSATKNSHISLVKFCKNREKAYEMACMCNPFRQHDMEDEEDEDEEEEADTSNGDGEPRCDRGKKCVCSKTTADLPEHPYCVTRAAKFRFRVVSDMLDFRDPDRNDMYTFNDHAAHGGLEVVQNMLLDFDYAWHGRDVLAAWSIVEAMPLFLIVGGGDVMCTIDDGELAEQTCGQIGRMVLAGLHMVATKDSSDVAKITNRGWIIATYIRLVKHFRIQSLLEKEANLAPAHFKFNPGDLAHYLRKYALVHDISLHGVEDVEADRDVTLPELKDNRDPFDWTRTFREFKDGGGSSPMYAPSAKRGFGGDGLDITTWTGPERKKAAYDNKDPVPRSAMKSIKEGKFVALG